MKKLKLNKLFHWLYAFLMLYPILSWLVGMAVYWFTGTNLVDVLSVNPWQVFNDECLPDFQGSSGIAYDICYVWEYLIGQLLGWDTGYGTYVMLVNMLSYWTVVSISYLVFDVFMLPINIAHHWIDKGSDRL